MRASSGSPIAAHGDKPWRYAVFERAKGFPEHLANWLNQRSRVFLLCFSVLYLFGTGLIASRRFLWADEVLTAYMARLSIPQLWSALKTGVDIEPPLFHLITRGFTSIFGYSPLALRAPAIVGGWLMCISLYVFVSRKMRPSYGLIAMLIPFVTGVARYTYEARCYGIALGFSGVALVCWQGAAEHRRRRFSLIGLAICLAAAIACQYYMFLVLMSIAVGEILRSISRAQTDRSVWIALAAAVIPLPLHFPFIRAAMTFHGGDWSTATGFTLLTAYEIFLAPAILPAAAIVTSLAVCDHFGATAKPAGNSPFSPWEILLGFALASSLAGAFLVAKLTNGIFTLRYGICLIFGFALLPLPVIWRYDRIRPLAGTLSLIVLAGFFTLHMLRYQSRFQTPPLLLTASHSSAIVIEDPLDFMELAYNAPPQVASRLYYLISQQESIRYTGTDDDERGLLLLRRWAPIQAEPLNEFLNEHKRILIWRGNKYQDRRWLLRSLIDHGTTVTLAQKSDSERLFIAIRQPGTW